MSESTYAFSKIKNVHPSSYIDAYNLVLECSQAHTPRSFSIKLLELLKKACPYDSAMVFFLDPNGKVSGKYAVGVKDDWLDNFLNYYLKIVEATSPEFNIYVDKNENSAFAFQKIIEWASAPRSEFIRDYIDALGLKYSWGFCFFDLLGTYRVVISLDRTRNVPFSEMECNRLGLALPILNNMYKNFFYQDMDTDEHIVHSSWKKYGLTTRETEIAGFLCQGMTVQKISSALYIAVTTTYKHISHIYEKVSVSSQQELLVKLLNKKNL